MLFSSLISLHRFIFFLVFFFNFSFLQSEELSTYESILQTEFLDEKLSLAIILSAYKSIESKELLKLLIKNPYHWNREAGLVGMQVVMDNEFNTIIINQFLKDSILRSKIRAILIKDIDFYLPDLITTYKQEPNRKNRKLLLSIIIITPNSEEFLRAENDLDKQKDKKLSIKER